MSTQYDETGDEGDQIRLLSTDKETFPVNQSVSVFVFNIVIPPPWMTSSEEYLIDLNWTLSR